MQAAQTATAEAAAELAEFDENIPIEDAVEPEMSRAEMEVDQLVQQLKPIERYAMRYVEENEAAWSAEQLAAAEAQIEEQKREWELNRQAAIDAEEARLREEDEVEKHADDDDDELVYTREPTNEVKRKRGKCSESSDDDSALSSSETDTNSGSCSDEGDEGSENQVESEEIDLDDDDDDDEAVEPRVQLSSSAPARKTRSGGRVDINLWTLDEESAALKATKRTGKAVNGKRRDSSDVDVLNVDEWTPPVKTTRSGRRTNRADNVALSSPSLTPRLRST